MNRCRICGGKLINDKAANKTYWKDRSIGIDGISAMVCRTCGRTYINEHMAENLSCLERPLQREVSKNPHIFIDKKFLREGDSI